MTKWLPFPWTNSTAIAITHKKNPRPIDWLLHCGWYQNIWNTQCYQQPLPNTNHTKWRRKSRNALLIDFVSEIASKWLTNDMVQLHIDCDLHNMQSNTAIDSNWTVDFHKIAITTNLDCENPSKTCQLERSGKSFSPLIGRKLTNKYHKTRIPNTNGRVSQYSVCSLDACCMTGVIRQ